ncbi:MAG: AIPR family protein [Gammaproteobacteria bacterium]
MTPEFQSLTFRVDALTKRLREKGDEYRQMPEDKLRSLAFLIVAVQSRLPLNEEEAMECITDGGDDLGVDAIYIDEQEGSSLEIYFFQAKYAIKPNAESSNFPENEIVKINATLQRILDELSPMDNANEKLRAKVGEIRAAIADDSSYHVNVVLCSNGERWADKAQHQIDGKLASERVKWEHFNHVGIARQVMSQKVFKGIISLSLSGKVWDETPESGIHTLVGRISALQIAELMKKEGVRLLENNVRNYLGTNKVNKKIKDALSKDPQNFYHFNNGITMICKKFTFNELREIDLSVNVEDPQIINGGQTCMSIAGYAQKDGDEENLRQSSVMLRLYEINDEIKKNHKDLTSKIIFGVNNQNPVDLRDLKSGDIVQKNLTDSLLHLGYKYLRQRGIESINGGSDCTIDARELAAAVLAILCERPNDAKYRRREHFGKLYGEIFSDGLNVVDAVVAVLLVRKAQDKRKAANYEGDNFYLYYADYHAAMLMGKKLFSETGPLQNHHDLMTAKKIIDERGDAMYAEAIARIKHLVNGMFQDSERSAQQLAAAFRRHDLVEQMLGNNGSSTDAVDSA